MKKSTIFIICLLCIAVAELIMVFKSNPQQAQNYTLDSKVFDMPVQQAENKVVKPFLFELHSANNVDAILDEFAADIAKSLPETNKTPEQQIIAPITEQEVSQTITEDTSDKEQVLQIEDEALEDISSDNGEPVALVKDFDNKEKITETIENELPEEKISHQDNIEISANEENNTKESADAKTETVSEAEDIEVKKIEASEEELKNIPTNQSEVITEDNKRSKIAIVIDDVGLSDSFIKEVAKIKAPLTISFLPYGNSNKNQVITLKDAGFEVMVHIPMMPHVPAALAPVTLSPEMDKAETQAELNKMLQRFDGTGMTGVNNHMGSLLTERTKNMGYVMEVLKQHGLFFLDSKTTGKSVAQKSAKEYGVTYISRDIFLDNKKDYNYILGQFHQAEKIAQKNGFAVAIGHPYSQTLTVLKDWLKDADTRGFEVVHISDLLAK